MDKDFSTPQNRSQLKVKFSIIHRCLKFSDLHPGESHICCLSPQALAWPAAILLTLSPLSFPRDLLFSSPFPASRACYPYLAILLHKYVNQFNSQGFSKLSELTFENQWYLVKHKCHLPLMTLGKVLNLFFPLLLLHQLLRQPSLYSVICRLGVEWRWSGFFSCYR